MEEKLHACIEGLSQKRLETNIAVLKYLSQIAVF